MQTVSPLRFLTCLFLSVAFLSNPGTAQTGGMLPKAAELDQGDTYAGAPVGDTIAGVDLRKYFPPVGDQSMNDCTAWAVAAAKSCLEAMDQRWNPTRPRTMFSPAFIYPQINHGIDEGSSLVAAALLLEELGAATLKTTPYRPNDFSTQPSAIAFTEALQFKNRKTYILETREAIKIALREYLPVVIGARLTPPFFSGTAESYSSRMHAEGMLLRDPNEAHAMHAMVLVGFDDELQRFLVRNSWGDDWGRAGYCWVDYSCFDSIDASASSETFAFLALAMEDEAFEVEATPDVVDDLKLEIKTDVRGEPLGWNDELSATTYRVSLELRGSPRSFDLVDKVVWKVPNIKGDILQLETKDPSNRFRALTVVAGEEQPVSGTVFFLDGTTREMISVTALKPPLVEDRSLSLSYEDVYWGVSPNWPSERSGHSWERKIRVLGSLRDRRAITTCTIDVGEQHFEYVAKHPKDTLDDETFTIFNPEPITATFVFKDGTTLVLKEDADPIKDPANDDIYIKSELHPIGDGRMSAFRVFLRVPIETIRGAGSDFKNIVWEVDGSQDHHNLVLHFGGWNQYEMTGSATRDFRVRATIFFDKKDPIVVEKWIELPDEGTAYSTPEKIDIWNRSFYEGRNTQGSPTWMYETRVSGDWQDVERIKGVLFRYTDILGEVQEEVAARDANGDWTSLLQGLDKEADCTATVHWLDAGKSDTVLSSHLTSKKPVVDGIFLETQSYETVGDGFAWTARLGGPAWHRSVHTMEYLYDAWFDHVAESKEKYMQARSPWQTVLRGSDGTLHENAQIFRSARRAGPLHARAYYEDGSMESFHTDLVPELTGSMSGPPENPIRLRLLERFLGVEAPKPFQFEFWLDAQATALSDVDHMLLYKESKGLESAEKLDAREHIIKECWTPGRYRLRLMMTDGTYDERQFEVSCLPLRTHVLGLRRSTAQIAVVGPEARLATIKKLVFHITEEDGATTTLEGRDYMDGHYDHAVLWEDTSPVSVKAELEFKDGSSTTLEQRLTLSIPGKPTLVTDDRFWGFDEGKPYWLLHHRLHWGGFVDGRQTVKMSHPGHTMTSMRSWPDFEVMEVSLADDVGPWGRKAVNISFDDTGWIRLPDFQLSEYKVRAPQSPALELKAEQTWENPNPSEDVNDEWLVRLSGPIQLLDEVDHVDYSPIYFSHGDALQVTWHAWQRFSLDGDGFPGLVFTSWLARLEATVYYRDERPPLELRWKRP